MKNIPEINQLVTRMEKRLETGSRCLKELPDGRLSYHKQNGSPVIVRDYEIGGKRHRQVLTNKKDCAAALLRRELLEAELASLQKDIKLIKEVERHLSAYDIDDEISKVRQRIPILDDELIQTALHDPHQIEWAEEPYEKSDYKPDELKHFTSQGLKVRSKSEVLIAERLYFHKQVFRYEQVMYHNGFKVIPDFTIRCRDGKVILWEHEGLTNSQMYLQRQAQKERIYASMGFVPWDNLIVTYDDPNGNIDLRIIESEIKNKLLR